MDTPPCLNGLGSRLLNGEAEGYLTRPRSGFDSCRGCQKGNSSMQKSPWRALAEDFYDISYVNNSTMGGKSQDG